MASAIAHFIVGAALALPAIESRAIRGVLPRGAIPVSCGALALAPDLDTIAMRAFAGRRSPRAAVWLGLLWAGCAVTHPLLDMLTDGGSGVMLLVPFSEDRLFFPWRPIHVSPLGIVRFFTRAGYILRSEMPFCIAAVAIGLAGCWLRHAVHRGRHLEQS